MKTTHATKKSELEFKWHLIDAKNRVLGRLATEISVLLIGKNKANYVPYLNSGDKVVVINSKHIVVTGKKELNKVYFRHSGVVGNLRERNVKQLREHSPNKIIQMAVKGMLPKNRLQDDRLANLYIYDGTEHPHHGQFGGKSNV